jgi:hypothetical protein
MGLARLLRRRLSTHPVALVAIVTSVLMSLVVVTALRLLAGGIADAGVRSALDVPAAERSFAVSASLRPGDLAGAEGEVRAALADLGPVPVTRVGTTTSRGIGGRAATDRAALADVEGLAEAADLVRGQWPTAPTTPGAPAPVVIPEGASRALGLDVGDRLALTDLVTEDAPRLTVVVTGVFRARDAQDSLWTDLPLALRGIEKSDFTSYGPFVVAPGTFDGPLVGSSTVTWRATPPVATLAAADLPVARERAAATAERLAALDLRSGRVEAPLPTLLDAAALVAERIRVALLTPTVLLAVLGSVSLVVAAALLAGLRDGETRLLRTRGASTPQLGSLALGEAVVVTALGLAGTAVLAPFVARAVAGPVAAGAVLGSGSGALWRTAVPLALVAVLVAVATALWVARSPGARSAGRRGRALRVAVGSGIDVVLVVLGVLAAVQLRRYDAARDQAVDPLTTAAPVLVVAGLAVLCLRLIPLIARLVARAAVPGAGLDLAWGAWQFSRRAAAQAGTLLLVLLAVAMGAVALSHSATAERAVTDQSAFDSGASLRVSTPAVGAPAAALGRLTEQASGGPGRVMPVWRTSADVGGLTGVTVLAVDASTAAHVMDPRQDTVDGGAWADAVGRLRAPRDLGGGLGIPEGARTLSVTARISSDVRLVRLGFDADLHLRDARGVVGSVPLGRLDVDERTVDVDLTGTGLTPPLAVVGVSVALPDWVQFLDAAPTLGLDVTRVAADGAALSGLDAFTEHSAAGTGLWWAAAPGATATVPVLATREVADAARAAGSDSFVLALGPREVPVRVVGVLDVLPTADTPTRGIVLDLPTLGAAPETVGGGSEQRSRAVYVPGEWWADPIDPEAAAATVRGAAPYGSTVVVRDEVVTERLANPVNAGMRSAMLLVTLASVVLAAVGFAATTAALGRTRRHENAVLLALGAPPRRIRRVLVAERVLVVVATVGVGLVLGVVAALTVVPLLVGGDGHRQVPSVQVALPAGPLAALALVITAVLSLVGVLVLRRTNRDLAAELREGESP